MRAKFVEGSSHWGTREHKGMSQREKLEQAILNLATALNEPVVERFHATGGMRYRLPSGLFQSASGTIVELSARLAEGNRR